MTSPRQPMALRLVVNPPGRCWCCASCCWSVRRTLFMATASQAAQFLGEACCEDQTRPSGCSHLGAAISSDRHRMISPWFHGGFETPPSKSGHRCWPVGQHSAALAWPAQPLCSSASPARQWRRHRAAWRITCAATPAHRARPARTHAVRAKCLSSNNWLQESSARWTTGRDDPQFFIQDLLIRVETADIVALRSS